MIIKPFLGQGNYTVFDNATLDYIMPALSPGAWKVLTLIVRQTVGWHRTSDELSYTQIMARTGIASKTTVRSAIEELLQAGLIAIGGASGRINVFSLNQDYTIQTSTESVPVLPTSTETVPVTSTESVPVPVQKMDTQKKEKKEVNKTEDDDDDARTGTAQVFTVWAQNMPGTMSAILSESIKDLIHETSVESVLHGIEVAVLRNARHFKFVQSCAVNHASGNDAPQRTAGNGAGYTNGQRPTPRTKVDESMAAVDRVMARLERGETL